MSDASVSVLVSGAITIATMIVGFLTLWIKLKYGTDTKIEDNTRLTKEGTEEAAKSAKVAVKTAQEASQNAINAKVVAESIDRKLNGGIDESIKQAVDPVHRMLEEHTKRDAEALVDVMDNIDKVRDYVHERNHDILGAINTMSVKLDAALLELKIASKVSK